MRRDVLALLLIAGGFAAGYVARCLVGVRSLLAWLYKGQS